MIFDQYPYLKNNKVVLHQLHLSDAFLLEEMKKEEEIYRYEPAFLPEKKVESAELFIKEECDRLCQEHLSLILGIYKIEDPDTLIGLAELYGYSFIRNKISIGVRLRKEFWHQGIATEAIALLKNYILNDLKLERITAHVMVDNIASKKALIKNGFTPRRSAHPEDWGFSQPVMAVKYVIYPDQDQSDE